MKPEASHEPVSAKNLLPFLQEMLALGKNVRLTVTGNSMQPFLREGLDSVLLAQPTQVKKLDVVLYIRDNDDVILHRIVRKTPQGFMILGDNQTQTDGPIPFAQIVAVASGFYRANAFFSAKAWWYRLYSCLWVFAGPLRRLLLPAVRSVGRLIKRLEKME
ncbi:MAG: hypothetical protein E7414_04825 [Ruminococcaceae bacterium]|nr:hypothetical protein [Oscillospiraceae bacterium]